MKFAGLIFDFDGVLIESEYVGNKQIADHLTAAGHPTSVEDAMREFMGLSGDDFHAAIERVAVIEDSPVGVTGAVDSGAFVIGLTVGNHCFDGHAERLQALGAHVIADSFEEVAAALA